MVECRSQNVRPFRKEFSVTGAGAPEYAFKAIQTGSWDNREFGMYVSGEALNWYSVDGMLRGISGAIKIVRNSSGVRSFLYDEAGSVSYESGLRDNKVYFGQKSVSPNFSKQGKFEGATIQSVSDKLIRGKLSASDLPIEYVLKDGKMITMNNRSLSALSKANMKPTVLINKTGNATEEMKLTKRLTEMGGVPSESIYIRKTKEVIHIPR